MHKKLILLTLLSFTIVSFGFTNDISIPSPQELELVAELGGTTGAQKMSDSSGDFWVAKEGDSPDHCLNEYYANQAYEALGVPVPAGKAFTITRNGSSQTVLINTWISGTLLSDYLKKASAVETESVINHIRKHFVADCLLGNWDALGLDLDNIIVDQNGIPWRIDNGGALEFRARGQRKEAQWGPEINELKSLLDPNINRNTAKMYQGITSDELIQQIEEIEQRQEALLDSVSDTIRPVLQDRFYYLLEYKQGLIGA